MSNLFAVSDGVILASASRTAATVHLVQVGFGPAYRDMAGMFRTSCGITFWPARVIEVIPVGKLVTGWCQRCEPMRQRVWTRLMNER